MTENKTTEEERINLHNELSKYKEHNKSFKFPYTERMAKEICLSELLNNEFSPINKDANKEKLKIIRQEKKALKQEIYDKCIQLHHKAKKKEELLQNKDKEIEKNKQLKEKLEKLTNQNINLLKVQKDRENIKSNLLRIEDKINEREKLENISENYIEKFINDFNDRKRVYENYMEGLDENTCDIIQQERHFMFSKGLLFMQNLLGFNINACEMVKNMARIHITSKTFGMYVYIHENRLYNVELFHSNENSKETEDVIRYSIQQNNLLYVLAFLYKTIKNQK